MPTECKGYKESYSSCSQWMQDAFDLNVAAKENVAGGLVDGTSARVDRGGSWFYDAGGCRAAFRYSVAPSDQYDRLGFRLARIPVEVGGK
jgi:formylglycine-generating enzyme required for sulfatase activity